MAHQLVSLGSILIAGNPSICHPLPKISGQMLVHIYGDIRIMADLIIIAVWAVDGASLDFTSDDQHYEYWYYYPNGCIIVSWCLLAYYFLASLFFCVPNDIILELLLLIAN